MQHKGTYAAQIKPLSALNGPTSKHVSAAHLS